MADANPGERTALYRLYDADDRLLYVGISRTPEDRWKRHDLFKWWWPKVARKTATWLPNWADALKAEAAAIREEKPRFNGTHNYPVTPFAPDEWPQITGGRGKVAALADLMRAKVESGAWPVGAKIPKREAIAEAVGVSESTAAAAYRILQSEGHLQFLHGAGTFVRSAEPIRLPNRKLGPQQAP
ncbi:GntR family transcriptional regulator [Streptomyces sp. NPDC096310]|uniref:GntR family transcriptional regulator n=1 Tax=Streptomyces sp. NPDC096310 TaxID=3366082 RepID=UPI0037FC41D5